MIKDSNGEDKLIIIKMDADQQPAFQLITSKFVLSYYNHVTDEVKSENNIWHN